MEFVIETDIMLIMWRKDRTRLMLSVLSIVTIIFPYNDASLGFPFNSLFFHMVVYPLRRDMMPQIKLRYKHHFFEATFPSGYHLDTRREWNSRSDARDPHLTSKLRGKNIANPSLRPH